jgi:hypothetical protein
MAKVMCEECYWHGMEEEMLQAPNPFKPKEAIIGCPNCKTINLLRYACSVANCWYPVSAGLVIDGVYKNICSEHARKEFERGL